MATKQQVLDLHRKHPKWTAPQIASRLGCTAAYVRATAQRSGLHLNRAIRVPKDGVAALGRRAKELGLTLADLNRLAV